MIEKTKKTKSGRGLLMLALLFFVNPNVHVIDVLPDFIGCFIIAHSLSYAAERAPYFAEAREGFLKLGVLGIAKIPAFLVLTYIRSGNVGDNDILSLFAFSFAVIEAILTVLTLNNLFSALFYLGERSDAQALLSPFPTSKKAKRRMSAESLKALLIGFSIYKCAAYSLPELLLLTKTVNSGNAATFFNVARLYPYVMVFAVPTVLILGIIAMKMTLSYADAINGEGRFISAIDSLIDEAGREALSKKQRIKDMKGAMTAFIVASVFTLELRFDNLYSINLFPRFIFGLILVYGIYRLSKYTKKIKAATVLACIYTLSAFALSFIESKFLVDYSYELLAASSYVKGEYIATIILSAIELAALAAVLLICAFMVSAFILRHTGTDRGSDRYMRTDAEYHKKMRTKAYIWAGIGFFSGITKFLNTVFRYYSRNIQVTVGEGANATANVVTEGLVPWFGVVVFAAAIAFIAYSMYLFTSIKEDTELKYL